MRDRFESTFDISSPPEVAWARLIEPDLGRPDVTGPALTADLADGAGRRWLPGFDTTGVEREIEHPRRLVVHKDTEPCDGTDVIVDLEPMAVDDETDGTRVTVAQEHFGQEFFDAMHEVLAVGWAEIVADLALFLETGVVGGRHTMPWGWAGWDLTQGPSGLTVAAVHDDTLASRLALRHGDVLLTVAGASLVTRRDAEVVMRAHREAPAIAVTWARDGRHMEATAGP